jgi:hypothetical protein
MIVSSLGEPLPANTLTNGVFSSGHPEFFSHLWDTADGTVPSDAAWSSWTGNARDVIVQRINLAPLFVHLLLGRYNSITSGYYAVDQTPPTQVVTIDGYFIQGSSLALYTNSTGISTRQIVIKDSAFVFEQGVWRGSLSGATMAGGVMDIGDVVQQFLNAVPNENAPNGQQAVVVGNMLSFMSNYNVWALPPNNYVNPTLKNYLIGIQGDLVLSLQNLYMTTPYITNRSACLQ